MGNAELEARLRAYVGREIGPPRLAADPVNEPMIRHWCQALEDRNPAYLDPGAAGASVHRGLVAPPTMLQAWILSGMEAARPREGPPNQEQELHALLGEYGYTSVVATNCEQGYDRYLRPGDRVAAVTTIEAVSEEKATALGVGYFVDTRTVFRDQRGQPVGWMTFRVLKFKPAQPAPAVAAGAAPPKPRRLRAPRGHDNGWWWEGIDRGELLIQKCSGCGALRHPPRPMCGACQSTRWESVVASGRGTVYSYVVLHHPPIPGYELPLAVGLIELDEGTRLVANLAGCDLADLRVGMRVQARIESVDEDMRLPMFHPAEG